MQSKTLFDTEIRVVIARIAGSHNPYADKVTASPVYRIIHIGKRQFRTSVKSVKTSS